MTAGDPAAAAAPTSAADAARRERKRPTWRRVLSGALSAAVVVGVFAFAIPQIADYGEVLDTVATLTPIELWSLVAVTIANLASYWLANMAALPGLGFWHAAIVTQTTTSVANTLPAGGAIAVGLTYQILRSWGFSGNEIALYVSVTGLWNIFAKLALPIVSVGLLVATGESSAAFVVAASIGLGALAVAVGILAALFSSERLARRIGDVAGRAISWLKRLVRRERVTDMGDRAVAFREDTIGLVRRRWAALTLATVGSHLVLFAVLLLSLRHVGVSEADVSTAQALAVFAFGRLISALPITPGGLGVIELGYIGGLRAAAGEDSAAAVVAAVLLFRVLTYAVQIPVGAVTYLLWRRTASPDRSS
ncbi:MAG TPA: lysylphosphatidylglycerol synthase domain-containing protein [Actinomycetota bacterium]|nr:lysylphosphatidylglycerol synthase domain-containing protein [Actinomycetota bacterium]